MLEASADTEFIPDIALTDGSMIEGDGWALEGIHTPGHAANHMAFGLKGTGVLFPQTTSWPGRRPSSRHPTAP